MGLVCILTYISKGLRTVDLKGSTRCKSENSPEVLLEDYIPNRRSKMSSPLTSSPSWLL